jgi:hypothetical protein
MGASEKFSFYSGGRHHFQGFGEWIFALQRSGELNIEQFVGDQKKFDKVFRLKEEETKNLWAKIHGLDIPTLKISERYGVPDEPQYRLILERGSAQFEVKIWANDVGIKLEIKNLVDFIKDILKECSKQKVVI